MQVFGNERVVQQGEDWNLDILVSQSNLEYIPFIVSEERKSNTRRPMFAITVASTKYEKNERYVETWWLDFTEGSDALPLFAQTVPLYIGEKTSHNLVTRAHDPMDVLYQYTLVSDKIDPVLGHKPYYYAYFIDDDTKAEGYDCRIIRQFKSEETAQWGSQNYMYQITLVDVIPMEIHIDNAHNAYPNLAWPKWITEEDYQASDKSMTWEEFKEDWIRDNQAELFTFIKNRISNWFQPDIDINSPAGTIDNPQVILPPTKLQVNNNLRRII